MKTLISSVIGLFLFSQSLSATPSDQQVDRELEAMAMVYLLEHDELLGHSMDERGKISDFFKNLKETIEGVKQTILDSFDTNGNGKIDPGPEWEAFNQTLQDVVMLLADSNQNGRIDLEDLRVLSKRLLDLLKDKIKDGVCEKVLEQGQAAGVFLYFRPLLQQMVQFCNQPE